MPTVTLTWDDINSNEDGFNIYRSTTPLDTANPANLPAPLATVAAGIGTYDDTTAAADTTYHYAVATTKGSFVNAAAAVQVTTAAATGPDFSTASVGDPIGGGYYAGTITYADARQFYLVVAGIDGDYPPGSWKASDSWTDGARDVDDGVANTADMLADTASHPPANYADAYVAGGRSDWVVPSLNELRKLFESFDPNSASTPADFQTGGSQAFSNIGTNDDIYWSSTQATATNSYIVRFNDGYGSGTDATSQKSAQRRTRLIRRIPVNP